MALAQEDIEFIKAHIGEWLADASLARPPVVYEIELRERMVRVEEELRHQRELIQTLLEQMDKRFDAVDKRFEQMREDMDKRFDAVDKRFEQMQQAMDKRFEQMQQAMDKRFEAADKRFEQMREDMDKRFENVDKRFDELTRRLDRFMFWSLGLTLSVGALVVAALRLWPS